MVKENQYFYLSGAISLSIFLLVSAGFSYMLFRDTNIKSFALDKKDFISVSLTTKISTPKKNPSKNSQVTEDITVPEQVEENVNIDELFSDVWTKNITKPEKVKEKTDNKRYNEILKKVQTAKKTEVESISEKIRSIDTLEPSESDKNSKNSSADEVNEYLAKIQATIYNHFEPPQNTQGKQAKVSIELSPIGKMLDFRILALSDNVGFNEEVKRVKKRLESVVFPKNPENKSYRLVTYIISDNKE